MTTPFEDDIEIILDDRALGGLILDPEPVVSPTARIDVRDTPPQRVDLRGMDSPVEDQKALGSCTANAIVGAIEFHLRVASKGQSHTDLSRMFVWYNARKFVGKENEKVGAAPEKAMAAIMAYGICPESVWPYMTALATQKPHDAAYEAAKRITGIEYARVEDDTSMMLTLARGIPVFVAIYMPKYFWHAAAADGHVPLPQGDWPRNRGGHAVLCVGYDIPKRYWIVKNSWGSKYGDNGYAYIPFEVFDHYSTKFLAKYGYPTPNWAIGAISETKGMSVEGAFQLPQFQLPELQTPTLNAAPGFPSGLKPPQPGNTAASDTLGSRLDAARSSLRDRLRGRDG